MPLYEYVCQTCGKRFDRICSSSVNDQEIKCPECGEFNSKKQLSLFSSRSAFSGGRRSAPRPRFT